MRWLRSDLSQGLGDAETILSGLRLTEIMFHPQGDPSAEFLELQNTGASSFDLGGLRFVEGVEFVFPAMTLDPGQFVYVVRDPLAFGHPELNVAGQYAGDLHDAGERLRLELDFGAGVVDVTYADAIAVGAGGGGNSLELAADGGLKAGRWAASSASGGTPGSISNFEDAAAWTLRVFTPADAADEMVSGPDRDPDGDGLVNLLERSFGRNPSVADAGGVPELELDGADLILRYPRAVSVGDVDLRVAASLDLNSWSTDLPGMRAAVVAESAGVQTIELRLPRAAQLHYYLRIGAVQR